MLIVLLYTLLIYLLIYFACMPIYSLLIFLSLLILLIYAVKWLTCWTANGEVWGSNNGHGRNLV